MNKILKGSLMTLGAGLAWGISGVSGQYLMAHGFDVNMVTSWRLLIAGSVLTALAYLKDKARLKAIFKDRQSLLGITLFAVFGLLLNQYTYLTAIYHTNAGTATVLQYICPIGILAYSCAKDRVAPTVVELLSMLLAVGGTFLIATHGQLDQLAVTPTGLFWGLLSAVTYALYIILPIPIIKQWGSSLVIGLGMLMGGLVFSVAGQVWRVKPVLTGLNILALIGIIGIGTIFAYSMFLIGTTLVGPVRASLLASVEPISSVFFAFVLLNERFYAIDLLGMAAILVAVLLVSIKDLVASKHRF